MPGRPGGVNTYSALLPTHQATLAAIPGRPALVTIGGEEIDMPFTPPPRDLILRFIGDLRADYPTTVGHPLDDEGIAAWVCDRFVALWQTWQEYATIKNIVYREIERVVNPR